MNCPGFQFSKHLHFPNGVMAIVRVVPLMPLLAQVAETHMNTWHKFNMPINSVVKV